MGLFTTYAIYKSGKRKGVKLAAASAEEMLHELQETCNICGHMRMQHSQDGRALCPSYRN